MHQFKQLYNHLLSSPKLSSWMFELPQLLDAFIKDNSKNYIFNKNEILIKQLPTTESKINITDYLNVQGELTAAEQQQITSILKELSPWRKGPFNIYNTFIDSEWQCQKKYNRVKQAINLKNKNVLDVGCGNGYYMWQMLAQEPKSVIGVDPTFLFWQQFRAIHKIANQKVPLHFIPLKLEDLKPVSYFDTVFSMGVLYHRKSPILHLLDLKNMLKPNGDLILETLIINSNTKELLIPPDTYAKMNNVWFIPSQQLLIDMLKKCGFTQIEVIDISQTTTSEQRRTAWMQNESLADFLNPDNFNQTIEKLPAPIRIVIKCKFL